MRSLCGVFLFLLWCVSPGFGQALINHRVLSGNGSDQPTVAVTDSNGFVYVAGSTTSTNFPVMNAAVSQPPQGSLEVSINGGPFLNMGLDASSVPAVAASSDGGLVLASTPAGIYRSMDQGATWTAAADVLPVAAALAVDPVNSSNAYVQVLNGALYKSTNGGVNWRVAGATPAGGFLQIIIDPQTTTTLYGLAWGSGSVYRSTDAAQSWQPVPIVSSSHQSLQIYVAAFALARSQPSVLYVSGEGVPIYKSADGGATWTQGADVMAAGPTALAVDPANPDIVWDVDGSASIRKSTDGGATFQVMASLGSGYPLGLVSVAIDPANSSRIYAATYLAVYESTDGGNTWTTALSGSLTSLYAAPSRIYTVGGGLPSTVFLAKLDPILSQVIYATYLWAGTVAGMAVDSAGGVYLAGAQIGGVNGVVTKVSADDSSVLYSTVLNGATPNAIAIDASSNAVIAGSATNLAVTKGAYQSVIPGPCARPPESMISGGICCTVPSEGTHAFLAKLNPSGALTYATYISGSCGDSARGLTLDSSGAIYVAGETWSLDFPVTPNATTVQFPATYDSGFVAKLTPAGDQLTYSSFLGGGDFTTANAVALDGGGNLYLAGSTQAKSTAGALQAAAQGAGCPLPNTIGPPQATLTQGENPFVMKMTLSAAPPTFLATLGGSCQGAANSIAFDGAGNIWLAGSNSSADFPLVAPIGGLGQILPQQLHAYASNTGFLAELSPAGDALLSATLTDSYGSVAADSTAVYYAGGLGDLNASGMATGNYSALVAEINPSQMAPIFIDEITQDSPLVPAASRLASAVAPGEIVRILGRGIGPQNQAGAALTAAGTLATSIGGVQVSFNGIPAPLVTAQANQVVAIAPFELTPLTNATVQVQYNGLTSNTYTVPVVAQNPDILAVANPDWTANSPTNPAGGTVAIFLTGLGQTNPASSDGAINRLPLAQPIIAPDISFSGNYAADVTFLGAAAYEVTGVYQLNLTPSGPLTPNLNGQFYGFTAYIGGASVTVYIAL